MKRLVLMTAILTGLGLATVRWAEAESPKPGPPKTAKPSDSSEHAGMAMGGGMMMGGGMCPMMGGTNTQMTVKNVDKGVTITFTSTDPAKVARLQKMAEAMRLMHEANTP